MSIPPGQPPGGYPYNDGATPPKKSGISGWTIAGIGCLGLFLLAALGVVLLVRATKDQFAHPSKNSPLGVGIIAGKAGMDGAHLRQAIVTYHQEKGQYPQSLMQLVIDNRIDGKLLHNDLDDNPSPAHISWHYTKPAEGAPGSTTVLEEPYQITMAGSTQSSQIVITLDGRSQAGVPSQQQAPKSQTP